MLIPKSKFVETIAPLIIEEGKKRGYKIFSTVIAQAVIESNYGQSKLSADYNNFFGLKCGSKWTGKSVNMKTREEYSVGTLTTIKDNFRAYDSVEEGVKGYYDFISTKRYANLKEAATPLQYAQFLKADGYATSSSYVNTLFSTVQKLGLVKYDSAITTVFDDSVSKVVKIRIGHASISENKTINGANGDSTGKEVCIREWYSKPWSYLIRAKNPEIAERMAKACEEGCVNNNIGYGQNNRNTAHTEAKKVGYDLSKIAGKCNTDCSAFMTLCAIAGGVKSLEYTGNAPTTSTMVNVFKKTGEFEVLTESKYLTSDKYLKRGDILVKPNSHTVMVLDNSPSGTNNKSVAEVADEVIKGLWGNGSERKTRLTNAGYDYKTVQAAVNKKVRGY